MAKPSFLLSGIWTSLVRTIGGIVDLEATAREFKARQRKRKIQTADALLRLALMWGPGRQSFREAAALAGDAGIAELSDKAVEGRLSKMGDWLAHILAMMLADRLGEAGQAGGDAPELSLVDGSVICAPGKGQDWRLHARYDPGRGRFADLVLTTTREAEAVGRARRSHGAARRYSANERRSGLDQGTFQRDAAGDPTSARRSSRTTTCQTALKTFQLTASKSFQLVRLILAAFYVA